jgi:hypothetical protein
VFPDDITHSRRCILVAEYLSVPQWTSILKLSALWQMDRLAELVLEELSDASASRDEWITLLDFSIEHQYPKARELAIDKITSTFAGQAIEQVVMARKYGVQKWLRDGFKQLLERNQFFSDTDEEVLGWNIVFKLCRLREQLFKNIIQDYSSYRSSRYEMSTPSMETSLKEIRDEFLHLGDEPEDIDGPGDVVDFPPLGSWFPGL